ncbi:uncharacterized protein LOC127462735 [Manacus candei]|uniref:uncharacterized protein LOC127462735 n=1 Tax=Manacus candei TaxID=415023 RepID=UPI00222734DB|nr:uncharacterized protein LOC127462735 [Manacus candei]
MMSFKTFRALSCTEKDIPSDSPLGCLLKHWKEGNFGQELSKKQLIDYCNNVWPQYETEGMQWPRNGSLTLEIITPLMRYLRENEKWDEIPYLDLFYYLEQNTEWQKECGILVLKELELEDDKCKKCQERSIKILKGLDDKHEQKIRFSEPEEDVSLLVSPGVTPSAPPRNSLPSRARAQSHTMPPLESSSDEEEKGGWECDRTPLAERTRRGRRERERRRGGGRETDVSLSPPRLMAPLREAVGAGRGKIMIKVPFSPNDLLIWKQSAGTYRENPERVARVIKMVIKTQDPDWNDLQVLIDTILDSTEKEMVLKVMVERAKERIRTLPRAARGTVNDFVPREDPDWDANNPADYKN